MSRNRFLFILTFVIAVALRFVFLGWKPPHFDESINGWFVMQVWDRGFYNYDPNNFHGPLYFYYLQLFELLFGRSVEVMRAATGLLSIGCIYLVLAHRRFVGNVASWAAIFIAISPAFVFYSRYAIHETLFIFAQLLFSLGFWTWRENRSWIAFSQMVFSVLILATTKETFFIFLGTWAIAIAVLKTVQKVMRQPADQSPKLSLTQSEIYRMLQVCGIAALILFGLFSNLFSEPKAFKEFFDAFAIWSKTGSGKSGHEKPFLYWIFLLARYEWPILLGLALTPLATLRKGNPHLRIFALIGFGTWLAYSIIPYKTPWLVMGVLWPLAFVLGWAIESVRNRFPSKLLLVAITLILLSPIVQTLRLNFVEYTNDQEPYVYVQSTKDIKVLMDLVNLQIERRPADFNMRVEVMTDEGWPFPWIFGRFPNLHFMPIASLEQERLKTADVILYDSKNSVAIEEKLESKFYRLPLQLRSAYGPGFALFRASMFDGLIPDGAEEKGKQ